VVVQQSVVYFNSFKNPLFWLPFFLYEGKNVPNYTLETKFADLKYFVLLVEATLIT
jgi:hypothetical protein